MLQNREVDFSQLTEDAACLAARHQSIHQLIVHNKTILTKSEAEAEAESAKSSFAQSDMELKKARNDYAVAGRAEVRAVSNLRKQRTGEAGRG